MVPTPGADGAITAASFNNNYAALSSADESMHCTFICLRTVEIKLQSFLCKQNKKDKYINTGI